MNHRWIVGTREGFPQHLLAYFSAALMLALATMAFSRAAYSQIYTSDVVGTITDPSGAVIPHAKVTLVDVVTGVEQSTQTNADGDYVFQYLHPGTYTLTVSTPGFEEFRRENIIVSTLTKVRVNATLRPGKVTQTVTVSAATPLLQTQTGEQSLTFPTQQIVDLPLNRGNYFTTDFDVLDEAKLLSPGVVVDSSNTWTVSEGGIYRRDQDYIDGALTTQVVYESNAIDPAPDSLQEIKVMTNSFSAVYGNTGGSITLATTKAGTNQFHGDVYEYLENTAMDAGDALAHQVAKEVFNNLGFTFGGPIKKNKLFLFGDAYWIRNFTASAFDGLTVPDQAWRNGDFSNVLGPQVGTDALGEPIYQNEIFNPATTRAVTAGVEDPVTGLMATQTGYVRDPFPGNIIPAADMSSPAMKLQQLYPAPTCASCILNNYTTVQPAYDNLHQYDIRLDYYIRPQDIIMGRWSAETSDGFGGQPFPGLGGGGLAPDLETEQNPVLDWVHTIGPQTTNEVHASYFHVYCYRVPLGYGTVSLSTYGITGLPNDTAKLGVPNIGGSASGMTGSSATWFLGSRYDTLELQGQADIFADDVLTMVRGKHTLQVGGEVQRMQINNLQPDPSNTEWDFNNDFTDQYSGTGTGETGWDYASFLVGVPANLTFKAFPSPADVRSSVYSLFAQDDFRVKPDLTLNLGLRWDGYPWWNGANGTLGYDYTFNPTTATSAFQVLGQNGFRSTSWNNDWANFGPRFGVAWSPLKLHNTVLRGGFGEYAMGIQEGGAQGGTFSLSPTWLQTDSLSLYNVEDINAALIPIATLSHIPYTANTESSLINLTTANQTPNTNPMDTGYQWNAGVEHELPGQMMLDVYYAGAHYIHLPFGGYNVNAIPLNEISTCEGSSSCLPYPQYASGALGVNEWLGSNEYNALQVSVQKRFTNGLTFNLGYTWEKDMDLGEYGYIDPVGDRYLDRAPDENNVPQAFTFSYVYDLPFGPGRHWLTKGPLVDLLGGWHWSGVVDLQSGYPLSPSESFNWCSGCGISSTQPNLISSPVPSGFTQNNSHWFNPAAFTVPSAYTVGDAGYGLFYGPGYSVFDTSIGKNFYFPKLGEGRYLQFRADFFNAFNTPDWGSPNLNVQSLSAGEITSEAPNYAPRYIQLGLKFVF
jgi:hypothetical protein